MLFFLSIRNGQYNSVLEVREENDDHDAVRLDPMTLA